MCSRSVAFSIALAIALSACGASGDPAPKASTPDEPAPTSADAFDRAAVLKAADAHDGTEDHVVSECTGCGLMMEGDPAHAVTVDDYELHFCSESCASTFGKDPDKGLKVLGKSLTN
jgi:hypothetical protein